MEEQKNNELIARFMGYETVLINNALMCVKIGMEHIPLGSPNYPEFYYHGNWNALMEPIEKISLYVYETRVEDNGTEEAKRVLYDRAYPRTFGMVDDEGKWMFRFNRMPLNYGSSLIEAAYKAVLEFITWYNGINSER